MSQSFKRPRTQAATSSASDSSLSDSFPAKSSRTNTEPASNGRPFVCTLPPTCSRQPTNIANSREMENHYAMYHAHVCAEIGCGCVFPDARLLELHQVECHDPLAEIRKERGEKTFGCHLVSCKKMFLNPKARRLHLIQAHGYPKEYFFAVTNKGVGGLLKLWGEGASMVRGSWKRRENEQRIQAKNEAHIDSDSDDDDAIPAAVTSAHRRLPIDGEDEDIDRSKMNGGRPTSAHRRSPIVEDEEDDELLKLVNGVSSLSLVPQSVRFGRGTGAGRGLGHGGRGGRAQVHASGPRARGRGNMSGPPRGGNRGSLHNVMDVDGDARGGHTRGRARGLIHISSDQNARGRGNGIVHGRALRAMRRGV